MAPRKKPVETAPVITVQADQLIDLGSYLDSVGESRGMKNWYLRVFRNDTALKTPAKWKELIDKHNQG